MNKKHLVHLVLTDDEVMTICKVFEDYCHGIQLYANSLDSEKRTVYIDSIRSEYSAIRDVHAHVSPYINNIASIPYLKNISLL